MVVATNVGYVVFDTDWMIYDIVLAETAHVVLDWV